MPGCTTVASTARSHPPEVPAAPGAGGRGLGRELAGFLVVGAAATVVSALLFNYAVHATAPGGRALSEAPLTAYLLSNVAGMAVSYLGTRYWVFGHRRAAGAVAGLVGFVVVNVLSWIIPLGCLAISRYALGLDDPVADNVSANVVGLALGTLARFTALRAVVFTAAIR